MSRNSTPAVVEMEEFKTALEARTLVKRLTAALQYGKQQNLVGEDDEPWYQSLIDRAQAKYCAHPLHDMMEEVSTLYDAYRRLDMGLLLHEDVSHEDVRKAVRAYEAHACYQLFEELAAPYWA